MTAANIARTHRKEHRPVACAPSGRVARFCCSVGLLYCYVAAECNSAGRTGCKPAFLALL